MLSEIQEQVALKSLEINTKTIKIIYIYITEFKYLKMLAF